MGLWTELVGVRKDLHLRGKWWHYVARAAASLGGLVVYFVAAGVITNRPVRPTKQNTFSVTLLTQAVGRQQTTTLADLDAMAGNVGRIAADGDIVTLDRPGGADGIQCQARARYKANEIVTVNHVSYKAIPDFPDQPAGELRHCVGLPSYSGLTAKTVVTYLPDGTGGRKQVIKGALFGIGALLTFLLVYWNLYYRGLMPFYARRRLARRQLREARLHAR